MKYPEDFINKVIQGDCLEVMKQMPDKSVDLVLTDPPYGIGAHNGTGRSIRKALASGKYDSGGEWDNEIPSPEVFEQIFRVSKYQIIFGGNYFPLPTSKSFIVWDKGETMYNRDFAECEMAWVTPDKPAKIFKQSPTQLDRQHPTQKPLELIKWCISKYSKDTDLILDPFLGSGTTALAAKQLGRRFIGIEISEKYCEISRGRLRQEILL